MSKKKKKRKPGQQHLGHKEMIQRHHKECMADFNQKVFAVLRDIHAEELLADLSTEELRIMYLTRFQSPKFVLGGECPLPTKLIKILQKTLDLHLKNSFFSFRGSDQKFTHHDYFNVVLTLKHWTRTIEKQEFPKMKAYLHELSPLLEFCATIDTPEVLYEMYLQMMSLQLTLDPFKAVFYMTSMPGSQIYPRPSFGFKVSIFGVKPGIKTVKFDGHNRSVWMYISVSGEVGKLGTANFPMLKTADISPTSLIGSLQLPVYYQKHVMDRLQERIDCFELDTLKGEMDRSLIRPELIPLGNMRALLTFTFFGQKLGYFVVEVIDGLAVLRTFLFLTNDGTPEGERLTRNLGLSKMDKTYTGLDRLSTFMHSDIKDDKQLHALLKESGCDGLMHTHSLLINSSTKPTAILDADGLRKYLLSGEEVASSDEKDQRETVTCDTSN